MKKQKSDFVVDGLERLRAGRVYEGDSQGAFFERQLEVIEARLYQERQRPLTSVMAIPVDTSGPAGAKTIGYDMYTKTGMAKLIAAPGKDLPRSDVYVTTEFAKVKQGGTSFGYTTQDLRAAALANRPLDAMKAESARRSVDELQNSLAWNGDASAGIPGFLTNPNVTKLQAPLNGAATSRNWANKTAAEIMDDISDACSEIVTLSKGAFMGNTLLLPLSSYELIRRKRVSDLLPMTILGWITSPEAKTGITEVMGVYELETAGPDGSRMMVVYEKSDEILQQRVPLPMTMHPPQQQGLEFIVPVEAEFAGTVVRYPIACLFTYGI